MSWAIAGLVSGFILSLMLLGVLLLRSRLPVLVKGLAIVIVTGFYWVQYASLQQYAGWPVPGELPDEFVLLATEVVEPNKQTGEQGAMYWWVRESGDRSVPPRVYQLPYVSEVHEESLGVLEQQEKGQQIIGRQSASRHGHARLGISFEKIHKPVSYQKDRQADAQ